MDEREHDDASVSNDNVSAHAASFVSSASTEATAAQHNIDLLFDQDVASWEPVRPPEVLGEFLDSRYMLPLLLPSDPVLLSATPKMPASWQNENVANGTPDSRSASQASKRGFGSIPWRITTKSLRETSLDILQWVDGVGSQARWARLVLTEEREEDECDSHPICSGDEQESAIAVEVNPTTPLTQRSSIRTKGRASS